MAWALGKIGDASALAPLPRLLNDPDENVLKEVELAVDVVKRQLVPLRQE